MILLSELPKGAQARIVEMVETAIERRRVLHFGRVIDGDVDLAACVVRRLRDYDADWDMEGEHLRVMGWADARVDTR